MKRVLWIIVVLCLFVSFGAGYWVAQRSIKPSVPDTLIVTDTMYLPGPVITKQIPVPVPADVDTAAILAAYHTQRIYNDSLLSTPDIQVVVVDTVYQNQLLGRRVSWQLNKPVHNRAISLGTSVAPNGIFMSVGYRSHRWTFTGGYDVYNKAVMVSAHYDIFQW